jgi:hypothetical protein
MNSVEPDTTKSKCTFLEYVENNPVAAVIQALAIGFAVGMVVRLLDRGRDKEPEIDLKHKPTLDDAKFHLGSLLLPLLWPAWVKAREGYGKSSETVKDVVCKVKKEVKKGKLTKEGKERLKEIEDWVEREAESLVSLGKKGAKGVEEWAGREAERLAELGKKAKGVEEWVEKEVLPAAESGWKKLKRFLG